MSNSEKYNFLKLKPKNILCSIMLVVVATIIIILFQESTVAYDISALVVKNDEEYYLLVSVPIKNVKHFNDNNYMIIDQKKEAYKIIKIEDNLNVINGNNYQNLIIKTNLSNKNKKENLIIEIKIILNKLKIYQKIGNILKERE